MGAQQPRILILSSSTGGGHDMRARSLVAWCERQKPTIDCTRYQALEASSKVYKFGVELYNSIQKYCPALHHLYFNYLEVFHVSAHESLLLGKRRFIDLLQKKQPDCIVSVHAHTNHAFRKLAKRVCPQLRFITYCGEMHGGYGLSRHWVDPDADAFIGATANICAAAQKLGMAAAKVHYGGFLLHPHFYAPPLTAQEKTALRADPELQLPAERMTLILSTGANGAQNHQRFITELEAAQLKVNVIALCGRNTAARTQLQSYGQQLQHVALRPLGYRSDMLQLMQVADAIVARPGTGTTSEAIMAGCPILFNTLGGVMPQEWITVKYMRAQQFPAQRLKKPRDLATQVRALLADPGALQRMQQQMQALRPPQTPQDIIERLCA
jgi:processive 1,2-diacylglycerol beta-glucosyltransferase